MYVNIICLILGSLATKSVASDAFLKECKNGNIDMQAAIKQHIEASFEIISEKASNETAIIYSTTMRLVKTKADMDALNPTCNNINHYLESCNDVLKSIQEISRESTSTIEREVNKMDVEQKCKVLHEGYGLRDIAESERVNKYLTVEYTRSTFSHLIVGIVNVIQSITHTISCILFAICKHEYQEIVDRSVYQVTDIKRGLVGNILVSLEGNLVGVYGKRSKTFRCVSNKKLVVNCNKMNAEIEKIENRIDDGLRRFTDCMAKKTRVAKNVANFKSMRRLLSL